MVRLGGSIYNKSEGVARDGVWCSGDNICGENEEPGGGGENKGK